MSLYNAINGVSPAVLWFLPMLGKHPSEYPRFRDAFIDREMTQVLVYTRVGGGNRESYEAEIDVLRSMPTYVSDCDEDYDTTYATFVFDVPKQWVADFERIKSGRMDLLSAEYVAEVKRIYPKLAEKIDEFLVRFEWTDSGEAQ